MTNVDITPIIQAAITLIFAVITAFIVPWIKVKIAEVKTKVSEQQWWMLQDWAKVGVAAAEVLFKGTKLGKDKLAYVTQYLNEICEKHGYQFDSKTIRQAIENAWKKMTNSEQSIK